MAINLVNRILLENFLKESSYTEFNQFNDWVKKVSKKVTLVSYKDLEIKEDIEKFLQHYKPKVKQCFTTSYYAATKIKNVKYVEGEGLYRDILPIKHGWNSYNGQYFDLTSELLFKGDMFGKYNRIIELDYYETISLATDLGYAGPFSLAYFCKEILNKWDEGTIERVKVLSMD